MYAAKDRDTAPLLDAMLRDLTAHHERLPDHPSLDSIFLGGGTPSLMTPAQISVLITRARESFGVKDAAEITLEANPNDILSADLQGWRSAGVNRLSIGVQSLDDAALTFLGRDHSASDARRAIDMALEVFPSVSIDLIYARPEQTLAEWEAELTDTLGLGAHHLSLYELTIEARTAFGKAAQRGALIPMPDDRQADLYDLTQQITREWGYPAYEVSNHASSAFHQSTHNMIYWQSGDWIGLGPGAHGRLSIDGQRIATEAARRPAEYTGAPRPIEEVLDARDTAREILAMGLRPVIGVELARIEGLNQSELGALEALGLVAITAGRLHTTPEGRLLTDAIAARLSP